MHELPGIFVISLDFELNWGVRDKRSGDDYLANLIGVRKVVPALLETFREYDVAATWATVGLLFFDNLQTMRAALPAVKPSYANARLSPYPDIEAGRIGPDEASDPIHYGKSLVDMIKAHPKQEICTHTFSHFYCWEEGQTITAFRADLEAAVATARSAGITIESIIFPRNQSAAEHLKVCSDVGIRSFRGNERWMYDADSKSEINGRFARLARLIDTYCGIWGNHTYTRDEMRKTTPFDIPSSRILRPVSRKLRMLEGLKLRRIKSQMTHAAERGEMMHLWWHPHNFGAALEENIAFVRKILDHFRVLRDTHGMRSMTMRDVAQELATS
jgi:peptidoglycan/xylan/chitin deacetylase (PgdA/CDA1 family)